MPIRPIRHIRRIYLPLISGIPLLTGYLTPWKYAKYLAGLLAFLVFLIYISFAN